MSEERLRDVRRRRVAVAGIVACVAAVTGTAVAASGRTETAAMPDRQNGRVVVTGCPTEDSCRIDYRSSRNGQPIWVVRRQVP